ncbi:hypothetical protein E9677_14925 [Rhizobium rhizophilum]|uniref:Uncharacterized protein n=2 Tax=Rhizobium rhizophilum TaxID=1850373 RepID=A0ABY2QUY1_9HYPH|nr:hypothetical protein E9677_14925 [Rhizobium rhizophilum]
MAAASRAAARDAERREKAARKERLLAESAAAVEDWQRHIDGLVSVHATLSKGLDWRRIGAEPQPDAPEKTAVHEEKAKLRLANFRPSLFDFLGGGTSARRAKMEAAVAAGASLDLREFQQRQSDYTAAMCEWDDDTGLARRLLRGEAAAIREVIAEMQALSENDLIGEEIGFSIGESFVHAQPKVHSDEIVPRFRRTQSAGGKVKETPLPVGQLNSLYQDYVASVALKTGGELLQLLPLDEVYVTCFSNLLDLTTGHKGWSPILSVHFTRSGFELLNLAAIDPSDALRNFRHSMNFSKQKGFSKVEPIEVV